MICKKRFLPHFSKNILQLITKFCVTQSEGVQSIWTKGVRKNKEPGSVV
jgi:hypothetical protein